MSWLYDYSKYKVKPANIPDDSHWVVMIFGDHHYTVPAWHDGDSPVTEKLKTVAYYAFTDKKEWEGMIIAYYLKKQIQHFFKITKSWYSISAQVVEKSQ